MNLIQPNDPQYFTETSSESYDRHNYRLEFNEGNNSLEFEDYEQLKFTGLSVLVTGKDCKVIVLDKKQKKKKTNGGFK